MADLVPMSQAATTSLVTTLQNTDLFALAREDNTSETGYRSKVSRVDALAKKVVNETDYSQLQTTDKKIIGAINEVNAKASKFDNMTATASGSIASFTDGGDDIPVSEYECEIVAQQASGTPTPVSPLPIIGFDSADISVSGINLWDEEWEVGGINTSTGLPDTNTNYRRSKNFMPCLPNMELYSYSKNNAQVVLYFYDENQNYISFVVSTQETKTTPVNCYYFKIRILNTSPAFEVGDVSINYPSTDTQYHAYKGNTYIVEFGQTIYGGRLIYKDGEWSIEATKTIHIFDGSETFISLESGTVFAYDFGANMLVNSQVAQGESLSTHFIEVDSGFGWNSVTSGKFLVAGNRYFGCNPNMSLADYQTFLASQHSGGTPVKAVCLLATPIIIPITSATRVKTISGVNNIFSNTGDNSVKYFTENADSLAELIKAFVL